MLGCARCVCVCVCVQQRHFVTVVGAVLFQRVRSISFTMRWIQVSVQCNIITVAVSSAT